MDYEKLKPFSDIQSHNNANHIIRDRSLNKTDIREFAIDGLKLNNVERVLDIGCGFGFMAEKYVIKISGNARVTGIDLFEENRTPFERVIKDAGRKVEFLTQEIDSTLPFESKSFDLVVSSFSLYFFPGILPEISRILMDHGSFIVITHSEHSFTGLYKAVGLSKDDSLHPELLNKFSGENGYEKLKPYFKNIIKRDFKNTLIFKEKHIVELLEYAAFKLPLLLTKIDMTGGIPQKYKDIIIDNLRKKKIINIDKNDAIFQCKGPLCH